MNFRHLLGCDTIVYENTRSGLSKTRNEQNNNNLARHAKVHSSYKSVRTYSLGYSFMSLDKLPIQPIRYSNNSQVFFHADTECISCLQLIYIYIFAFKWQIAFIINMNVPFILQIFERVFCFLLRCAQLV